MLSNKRLINLKPWSTNNQFRKFKSTLEDKSKKDMDSDVKNPKNDINTCWMDEQSECEDDIKEFNDACQNIIDENDKLPEYYRNKTYENTPRKQFIACKYQKFMTIANNEKCDNLERLYRKMFYSVKNRTAGLCWGLVDGAMTGFFVSGKWCGNGGWIVGGISQGCGACIGFITIMTYGGLMGLLTSREEVADLLQDYRYTFGSTLGDEVIKPNIEIFPGYMSNPAIVKGDRKYR